MLTLAIAAVNTLVDHHEARMRPKNEENWRRQVQLSMSKRMLDALDELAKLDATAIGTTDFRWYAVGGKPNRSGTVQRLIKDDYEKRTGKKLRLW